MLFFRSLSGTSGREIHSETKKYSRDPLWKTWESCTRSSFMASRRQTADVDIDLEQILDRIDDD